MVIGVVSAALLVASCMRSYSLDCGPLNAKACDERATVIESVVSREFVGRRVASIVILNPEGHAQVILDDGTKLGFGERDAAQTIE
jgi:hypothetical protein